MSKTGASRSSDLLSRLTARECPAFQKRRQSRARGESADAFGIILARGEGSLVWDADGRRYLDCAAGFGSVLLGHGDARVAEAVSTCAGGLTQGLGDLYSSELKVLLLERLAALHSDPDARVLLTQSGADAITAALKTASLATGKHGVIAFEGGYHGLGYAPLAACGFKETFRSPFAEQLSPHVRFVPYPGDRETLEAALSRVVVELARGDVAAILVEPILGRGGLIIPPDSFLSSLSALAKRSGALLIADEIWTGLGRSGAKVFSSAAKPDIVCFGKGLGGGLSISACVASDEAMQGWARSGETVHTSTHAGAPITCAAALALLDAIEADRLVERSAKSGELFLSLLRQSLLSAPLVKDIRGAGLMIGIELGSGFGFRAMARLLELGLLVTTGGHDGDVLVLTPPLTIGADLIAEAVAVLGEAFSGLK